MSVDALNANALVTIPEARRFVYRDEDDGSRDGILVDAINMASDAVLSGNLITGETGVARRFEVDRSGFVDLRPFELRSVTSIKTNPDRDVSLQQTLTTDQYRLFPIGGSNEATYLWAKLFAPDWSSWPWDWDLDAGWPWPLGPDFGWQVEITGDWGLAEVPGALKLGVLQWIKNIVENPGDYGSYTMNGYTIIPAQGLAVPGDSPGMPSSLRSWKRRFERKTLLV